MYIGHCLSVDFIFLLLKKRTVGEIDMFRKSCILMFYFLVRSVRRPFLEKPKLTKIRNILFIFYNLLQIIGAAVDPTR